MAKWNGGRNKRKYLKLAMEFEETGIPSGNGRAYCDYADICDNIDDKISYYKKVVQYKNILALEKLILIYFYGDKTQQHDLEKVKEYSVMLLNWERRYGYLSRYSYLGDRIISFITGILLYKGERVERNIYEGIARIWDAIKVIDNYDEYGVEEPDYNDEEDEEDEENEEEITQQRFIKELIENYTLDLVKENVTDDVVYAYWIRGGLIYVQTQINGIGQDVCIYFIEYDKLFDGFKGKLLYTINSSDMLAYKPVIKSCSDYGKELYLLISFFNWGTAIMIDNNYDIDSKTNQVELYNDFDIKRFNDFKVTSRKKLYIHNYAKLVGPNHTHHMLSYGCSDNQNRCIVSTWKGEPF